MQRIFAIFFFVFIAYHNYANSITQTCDSVLSIKKIAFLKEFTSTSENQDSNFYKDNFTLYKNQLNYIEDILCTLSKQKPDRDYAVVLLFLGNYHYSSTQDYKKADDYFLKAYKHKKFLSDKEALKLYLLLADSEKIQQKYTDALFFFKNALNLAKKIKANISYSIALREIGVIYRDLKDYPNAKKYFHESLEYCSLYNNCSDLHLFWLHLHTGGMYRELKEWSLANTFYTKALDYFKSNPVDFKYSYILHEIARLDKDRDLITSSEEKFLQIYKDIREHPEERDRFMIPPTLINLGEINLIKKDTTRAIAFLFEAFDEGKSIGFNSTTENAAILLYNLLNKEDERKNQISTYLINSYKNQSDFNKNTSRFAEQLENLRSKEKLIEQNQEIQENQKLKIILLTTLFFIVLFSLVVIFYLLQTKNKLYGNVLKQKEHLTELNLMNNKLLSIIGHDLKNPLVAVKSVIYMIKNNNLSFSKTSLEDILQEIDALNNSIDNILSWAQNQMNSGKFEPEPDTYCLYKIVNFCLDGFYRQALIKNITISNQLSEPLEKEIYIDKDQLMLVIRNILSNAIKFTKPNGTIKIYVSEASSYYILTIEDNGIGMTKKMIENIMFSYSKNIVRNSTEGTLGTGLGLNISKDIMEKNKGGISIESETTIGTKIHIQIPKEPSFSS